MHMYMHMYIPTHIILCGLQYLMQCYLKIQQQARKQQAEREHVLSAEHDPPGDGGKDMCHSKSMFPTIHFVETASSVLRELPWILPKEYKVHLQTFIQDMCA